MRIRPRDLLAIVATGAIVASYVLAGPTRTEPATPTTARPVPRLDPEEVIFVVSGARSDVWRTGVLDRFDGEAWRLPPYRGEAALRSEPPPTDIRGRPASAFVTIHRPRGIVLPTPALASDIFWDPARYDLPTDTFRLEEQPRARSSYEIHFHPVPPEDSLAGAAALPERTFVRTGGADPPRALERLIDGARARRPWRVATATYSRLRALRITGDGIPMPIDARRIREILTERETTSFEFVALGTLALRWAGVPARIAYGYERGEGDVRRTVFRARDFGLWTEVALVGIGWVPVPASITPLPTAVTG